MWLLIPITSFLAPGRQKQEKHHRPRLHRDILSQTKRGNESHFLCEGEKTRWSSACWTLAEENGKFLKAILSLSRCWVARETAELISTQSGRLYLWSLCWWNHVMWQVGQGHPRLLAGLVQNLVLPPPALCLLNPIFCSDCAKTSILLAQGSWSHS